MKEIQDHRPDKGDYRYVPVEPNPAFDDPAVRILLLGSSSGAAMAVVSSDAARSGRLAKSYAGSIPAPGVLTNKLSDSVSMRREDE